LASRRDNLVSNDIELFKDGDRLPQRQKRGIGHPMKNVLLKVLAVGVAHTVNTVRSPHDDASTGRLAASDALARALTFDMANWWQPTAANYLVRIKKDQILQAIQEATGAPVKERLRSRKKQDLAAEAEKSVTGTR
jgi:ParB family transcriptional regulator, chromosome partitioning protein